MAKTLFSNGNPLQGILGTIVNADWLNKVFNHRHDGLDQDGSAPSSYAVDQGAANAYVIALTPALTAHIEGLPIYFKAANANTGASTLSVNGLAAEFITMPDGSAISAGAIKSGQVVTVIYTGAAYMIVSRTSDSPIPSGTIIQITGNVAPTGFIKANGALLLRTSYATLWAWAQASGNIAASDGGWNRGQYSPGDGATTFRIPDLRGDFIRNWDDGAGVDIGRSIGSWQGDDFKTHTHSLNNGATGMWTAGGNNTSISFPNAGPNVGLGVINNTGGTETRPRNTAYLACIKY